VSEDLSEVAASGRAFSNETLIAEFMSRAELAAALHKGERQLQRYEQLGTGPPPIRVGKTIFYRRAAVAEWLRSLEKPVARPHAPQRLRGRRR
jgi:hypothetical protein